VRGRSSRWCREAFYHRRTRIPTIWRRHSLVWGSIGMLLSMSIRMMGEWPWEVWRKMSSPCYGAPTRCQELPGGYSWAYDAQRLTFQLRDGLVVSWLRF
jgi:hypothetical protein